MIGIKAIADGERNYTRSIAVLSLGKLCQYQNTYMLCEDTSTIA